MLRTPLHHVHKKLGAKLVEFGGWEMPVQYTSITEEHVATRTNAGLFDLSHMGRLELTGKDRTKFLSRMTTAGVEGLPPGKGKYSFLCDPEGGVIDDIVIYSFADFIRLVVNAGNRIQVLAWLGDHKQSDDVEIEDLTSSVSMIAIQGPRAESILQRLVEIPLGDLPYYWARAGEIAGDMGMISRTGYTGEDGFELYVQTDKCERTWSLLSDVGARAGLVPSGLGARDTLRLEAGMPLYGHELSRDLNPIQAGLHRFVDLEKEFIGRDALLLAKENKEIRRLVGLAVEGRRIPRQGADVYRDNRKMGVVTSGTHSPTLQKTIALAYLEGDAPIDSLCEVDIRGKRHGAKVTAIPFYKREK